ncbi:MAG: DUF4838 domain-containing protein [Armatimonadota bacterium]|nr:DUF4838 domain-containing protein [Armatimonadota bacterium]
MIRYPKLLPLTILSVLLLMTLPHIASASPEFQEAIVASGGKCDWIIFVHEPPAGLKPSDVYNLGWAYWTYGFEKVAADELASLIEKMTGAKPQVATVIDKSEIPATKAIVVGSLAADLGAIPPKSKYGIDGSVVQVEKDRILLAGETPLASYFAMVRLAEMAGCRWYMPGELGEIIPKLDELAFKEGNYEEVPTVWSRYLWFHGGDDAAVSGQSRWLLHNRQYGRVVSCGHNWENILPASRYFKDHPEWYASIHGNRVPFMLCTTNEEMTKEFIKNLKELIKANPSQTWWSISQDDGNWFCDCGNCRALDPNLKEVAMPDLPQITDRLVNFYNKVATEVVKEYPDKYFCFLAYISTIAPPLREKPHPHLMPMIAPIFHSSYRPIGAPDCEDMQALKTYVEGWSGMCDQIAFYDYGFNLNDLVLPYTRESQTRLDMPFLARNKTGCVCIETSNVWQNLLPYYYLLARMNIDPGLDADKVVNEFYRDFFGPAASDMQAYMTMLDRAYSTCEYEVGGEWIAPIIFTPRFMKKGDALLSSAERKARGDKVLQRRIEMWRFGFEDIRLFFQLRKLMHQFKFPEAKTAADAFYDRHVQMQARNPFAAAAASYGSWGILWKEHIDFSGEKLKGGRILHKFSDEWYAFPDYAEIGEIGKLYSPEIPLAKWMKLKTYSKTIGEQKLTRFRGTIWYRNSFTLKQEDMGGKIHILFSGVSNRIAVYINSKRFDPERGLLFGAFDFDITEAVKAGENTVVCSVNDEGYAVPGLGGIMQPVVLYSPAKAEEK